jgi:hypothetical protein
VVGTLVDEERERRRRRGGSKSRGLGCWHARGEALGVAYTYVSCPLALLMSLSSYYYAILYVSQ